MNCPNNHRGTMTKKLTIGNVTIGGGAPLALIAGPCVMEDEKIVLKTAEQIKTIADKLKIGFVFKSSYKKDNRSSAKSYQGPGIARAIMQGLLEKLSQTGMSKLRQAVGCEHK